MLKDQERRLNEQNEKLEFLNRVRKYKENQKEMTDTINEILKYTRLNQQ